MMIVIAIAGSLVVYAWTMGYIDLSTGKSEQEITIHSIANHEKDLLVYVQNTGESLVQLEGDSCLYVNGELVDCAISYVAVSDGIATLGEGETAILTYVNGAVPPGEKVEVKVTTFSGGFSKYSDYPAGTAYVPPVLDHFAFDTVESPQTSGTSFRVTVRALDQYDKTFAGYNGVNNLTCSVGEINPVITGSFLYGLWSGEVTVSGLATNAAITTIALSNSSWTGTSNMFNIEKLPSIVWNQTYGGAESDYCTSLVEVAGGGYAITGYTKSFASGYLDFWLIKTDASGNREWSKTYGTKTGQNVPRSIVVTPDGGYAIAGSIDVDCLAISRDFWLIKTDENGNEEWRKSYGGTDLDEAHSMVVTSDGGFAIAGETRSFSSGNWDFWLVKTDEYGTLEWSKTYGAGICESLIETSEGGYVLAGDNILVKTDEFGTKIWKRVYDDASFGGLEFKSVVEASDGGYVLAGYTDSGAGYNDFFVVKTDAVGEVEWTQTYGGTGNELAYSVVEVNDGGYAIGGFTSSFGVEWKDFWLVKIDALGNVEWNKTYGGQYEEVAWSLVVTSDGGYIMGGWTWSFGAGTYDFWVVKTDGSGNTK